MGHGESRTASADLIHVRDLAIECIIGVYPAERDTPQTIWVDVEFEDDYGGDPMRDEIEGRVDYAAVADAVRDCAVEGKFQLIEALAHTAAQRVIDRFAVRRVRIAVRKPGALADARCVEVEVERVRGAAPQGGES